MKRIIFFLLTLVFLPSAATADLLIFKSGSAKEAIIEEETPTSVKIRVKDAVYGILRRNIERIEYATDEENLNLELRWREEKRQREEQRMLRQQEEEKFEKDQKKKGLVKVGDRWLTKEEKAELDQQKMRQKIEARRARARQRKASTVEAAEEVGEIEEGGESELPEFFEEMTPQERRRYLERLKKIVVSDISVGWLGEGLTALKGRVTNKSRDHAENVFLEILLYDEKGEVFFVRDEELQDLGPNRSRNLFFQLDSDSAFIHSSKVRVIEVEWR